MSLLRNGEGKFLERRLTPGHDHEVHVILACWVRISYYLLFLSEPCIFLTAAVTPFYSGLRRNERKVALL